MSRLSRGYVRRRPIARQLSEGRHLRLRYCRQEIMREVRMISRSTVRKSPRNIPSATPPVSVCKPHRTHINKTVNLTCHTDWFHETRCMCPELRRNLYSRCDPENRR